MGKLIDHANNDKQIDLQSKSEPLTIRGETIEGSQTTVKERNRRERVFCVVS